MKKQKNFGDNTKKITGAVFLAITAAALLMGCGTVQQTGSSDSQNTSQEIIEPDKDTGGTADGTVTGADGEAAGDVTQAEGDNVVDPQVCVAMNRFAVQLFDQVRSENNLFFSPYSVTMALSMADNGADNDTKAEMEDMLGVADLEQWNRQMQLIIKSFTDQDAVLNTANSVWLNKDLVLAENAQLDFFQPVGDFYGAQGFQVDFSKADTLDQINQWVSDNTNKMIDPFLTQIDPDLAMCLINAVYFDGKWQTKFAVEDTYSQMFYGKNGDKETDTMHLANKSFRYADLGNLRGIELPYGSGDVVMDVWIPGTEETGNISDILNNMTIDDKLNLNTQMDQAASKKISNLSLPKFTMESDLMMLNDALKQCGMIQAFDPEQADFSKLAENLYIDQVAHKAKIQVDENGTKAAAATGIMVGTTAVEIDENIINFTVDHPFYYCIRDTKTGVILFMGVMEDIP